jgi:hypothetical protein
MRFHGYEVLDDTPGALPITRMEGRSVRLRLWWSADAPLPMDYSVGLYLMRNGGMLAQIDGPPQLVDAEAPRETSRWQPGVYYIEEREIVIPQSTSDREYAMFLTVYQWWDNVRLPAGNATNTDNLLPLMDVLAKTS